ncbi:sulfatase-like hydrolase/transferase [Acidobacteriota bacterium]
MDRRKFIKNGIMSLGVLSLGNCTLDKKGSVLKTETSKPPNIVLILADDMGYGDIQAFNPDSRIPTPHLNALAQEGIRFTDAHSGSAVCSPTRYGLLTGRYCWRTELKSGVLWPPQDKPLIGPERLTVAGMLKQNGYHTACFGKWHVGLEWGRNESGEVDFNKPLQYGPRDVGFDESFIIAGSLDMVPYAYYNNHIPTQPVTEEQPGLPFPKFIRQGPRASDFDPERVLDRLTEQAVKYITSRSAEENPFFLYLPFTAPHKPVWPAERFKDKTELGAYGDFIHQTDWSVGQVLQALQDSGISDDTIVIFTSDNGSYMYRWPEDQEDHLQDPGIQGFHTSNHQSNADWRGTKADVWEGGHRVPFIVRWPGQIDPGSSCGATVCLTDVMATCAEITGSPLPDTAGEDSFSLSPLLINGIDAHSRAPVIHHSSNGIFSLREGDWKMVFGSGSGGRQKPVGKPFEKPFYLFNLKEDPSEQKNVIDEYPEVARELEIKLEKIIKSAGSRFVQLD